MSLAATNPRVRRGSGYARNVAFTRRLGVIAAAATFLMLLAMTIGTALGAKAVLNSQSEQRFAEVITGVSNSVRADLDRSYTEIAALEAFIRSESQLTNERFQIFASSISQRTAGSEALGFAPRVPAAEAAAFGDRMRSEGVELRDFTFGGTRADRYPVAYLFPPIDGLIQPGGNLALDPRFGTAVQESLRSGSPAASGPITLRTNPSGQPWFLVVQPVFGDPAAGRHPSEGPLMGYAFSVYRTADFLAGPLVLNDLGEVPLRVLDTAPGRDPTLIFPDLDPEADQSLASGWVQTSVDFAGRRWLLQFETPDQFGLSVLERNVWIIVLSAGLGLTVFASISMFSLLKARSAAHSDLDLISSQIRVIVGSAVEGIVILDSANRLILANRSFADAFGMPDPDRLARKDWSAVRESAAVDIDDRDGFFEVLARLGSDPRAMIAASDVRINAPVPRTLSMSSSPVNDAAGEYLGRLFVFRDVTAERSAESAKSDFVAMVSHELRTPLTSIVGYVDLLLEGAGGELSDESSRLLQVVRRNSNRLARLVADILDLSRIDSARFELEYSEVDLVALVEETAESMSTDFSRKKQDLRLELADYIPAASVDRVRMTQVVTNLLTNAHRYTPARGSITVTASTDGENAIISVRDTGVGISVEDMPRLFDRFVRIDRPGPRPAGSTGLGLAITRALVELHRGSVTVASKPGRGSEFTVTIPLRSPAAAAA